MKETVFKLTQAYGFSLNKSPRSHPNAGEAYTAPSMGPNSYLLSGQSSSGFRVLKTSIKEEATPMTTFLLSSSFRLNSLLLQVLLTKPSMFFFLSEASTRPTLPPADQTHCPRYTKVLFHKLDKNLAFELK